MKYRILLAVTAWFSCMHTSFAEPIITFFFKPYPADINAVHGYALPKGLNLLQKERFFARTTTGIFASYGGFLTVSDIHGEVSFPRRHEKPSVTILVTDRITPMIMGGLTINHWEREEGTPAILYRATRQKNAKTNKFEWIVKEEALPESVIVRPETIIIFADPSSIVVPSGVFPAEDTPNLHLPDLYVKAEIAVHPRTLYVINIKHFFGPIYPLYKKKETLFQRNLID